MAGVDFANGYSTQELTRMSKFFTRLPATNIQVRLMQGSLKLGRFDTSRIANSFEPHHLLATRKILVEDCLA
jgi:hypothetical protein